LFGRRGNDDPKFVDAFNRQLRLSAAEGKSLYLSLQKMRLKQGIQERIIELGGFVP
jgi:hypothetical protein